MARKHIKVNEDYIQFENSQQLKLFVDRYSLDQERFEFEFLEPVKTGGGEVYIPEDIVVNESRLENLDKYDSYNEFYRIKNTKKTLKFYIVHIRKQFADLLKKSQHDFMMLLYEGVSGGAIGGIITHALYDSRNNNSFQFSLWLMKIYEQDRDLFWALARSGLYALGTAFAVHKRQSFLHRNAFQMGLVADINLGKEDIDNFSLVNQNQSKIFQYCDEASAAARQLGLSEPAINAIRLHMDPEELLELPAEMPSHDVNIFDTKEEDEPTKDAVSAKELEENKKKEALDRALLSIMRLTRYLTDAEKTTIDLDKRLQTLIGGLAYLTQKNLLPKIVAQPILKKCQNYKKLIAKMKKIAQVEASCTKNDLESAWAYPKPDATQIICLNNHTDCPNFMSGRPLHVTGLGDASLLRYQKPGEFYKCKLADKL